MQECCRKAPATRTRRRRFSLPSCEVAEGAARFRGVNLGCLSRADLSSSKPNPALYSLTTKAQLGMCDAFVSHSWSDDKEAKWEALQQWRRTFVAKHGREPVVWIDKCCIDQNNIEPDLRLIPVFLSGCKELVVLCGPTYLSRLWCVLELIQHRHLSREPQALTVIPVLRAREHVVDMLAVQQSMEEFDVDQCQCTCSENKDRIISTFLAAFGTRTALNEAVRVMLRSPAPQAPGDELGGTWATKRSAGRAAIL